jgi:hypothetical protein
MRQIFTLGNDSYVVGLKTFLAFANRKLDLLAFLELAVTIHLDGAVVDKNFLSLGTEDKSVPFFSIKPFDRSDFTAYHHCDPSFVTAFLILGQYLPSGRSYFA